MDLRDKNVIKNSRNILIKCNDPRFNFGIHKEEDIEKFNELPDIIDLSQYDYCVKRDDGDEANLPSLVPLSQAQANQDISVVSRFLEMIGNGFGPDMLQLLIDGEQTAVYLAKKFGVPESLIRDEEQRKQIAEAARQLAEQQAMQQGMMPVEQQG
jgi:hypothetical protein